MTPPKAKTMFTGIIESKGTIQSLTRFGDSLQIHLRTGFNDLVIGESVAVNGVCLTVTRPTQDGECDFFLSPETLEKTNLNQLIVGNSLNLERALTLQTRLSGHWVQGHVDGQATWMGAEPNQPGSTADPSPVQSYRIQLRIPSHLARYCVPKGSICLNGVSLTLNSIEDFKDQTGSIIQITIIPHTWTHTNLSELKPGDPVNVEVDILAKYVERLCHSSI